MSVECQTSPVALLEPSQQILSPNSNKESPRQSQAQLFSRLSPTFQRKSPLKKHLKRSFSQHTEYVSSQSELDHCETVFESAEEENEATPRLPVNSASRSQTPDQEKSTIDIQIQNMEPNTNRSNISKLSQKGEETARSKRTRRISTATKEVVLYLQPMLIFVEEIP